MLKKVFNRLHKYLCGLGLHDLVYDTPNVRHCPHCNLYWKLEFYSNRTQKWVKLKLPFNEWKEKNYDLVDSKAKAYGILIKGKKYE